ncbi:hypothetical protein [Fictibacillus norfolkensis]|uniref:Uncharacterized protein n=1 Tax=Fictibacillus norfolkensis TaxID=2762233 RepID=A0ABR8SN69_9BACL|nr:hypothetical protein [Fictibacillus norfolkensis]MBD7964951.1 hypothetical protein [Fictibacillus norfolkensis]
MNLFSSITEESFNYLIHDYGFSEPIDTDGSWKTTFLYTNDQLAIEIELNYRDMDTFIFMKKMSEDQECDVSRMQLEEIINIEPIKSKGDQTTIEEFEKGIVEKAVLLKTHLNQIINKKERIFS